MKVEFKVKKDDLFVILKGYFGLDKIENFNFFKRMLWKAWNSHKTRIIVDLEEVRFIDSAMIGVMLKVMKTLELKGREFYLINTPDYFSKLFKVIRLDQVFKYYPSN
jgi:anti-anti-sigma factor